MKFYKYLHVILLGLTVVGLTACQDSSNTSISGPTHAYLPATGTTTITVTNVGAGYAATNVTATQLPSNVTSSTCASIGPLSTCTLTLTANGASVGSTNISIAGANTNAVNTELNIATPSLTVSGIDFTAPGIQTATVANTSHFNVNFGSNSASLSNSSYGISITGNTCTGILTPGQTCTVSLTASDIAQVPVNSNLNLVVTGTTSTANDTSGNAAVATAPPTASINSDLNFIMDATSGADTEVAVTVGSGFDVSHPSFNLYEQGTNTPYPNVTISTTTCSDPMTSDCEVTLHNNANLSSSQDATLTLTGDNLADSQSVSGNVSGSVAINAQTQGNAYYGSTINGPKYDVISVQNTDSVQTAQINTLTLSNSSAFHIIDRSGTGTDTYYDNYAECATVDNANLDKVSSLSPNTQCIIVLQSVAGSPDAPAQIGTFTIDTRKNGSPYTKTFDLNDSSYLYLGGYPTLYASASLYRCSQNSCSPYSNPGFAGSVNGIAVDPAQNVYIVGMGSDNNNYINKCTSTVCSTFASVEGNSVNGIAIDTAGNIYVGGTNDSGYYIDQCPSMAGGVCTAFAAFPNPSQAPSRSFMGGMTTGSTIGTVYFTVNFINSFTFSITSYLNSCTSGGCSTNNLSSNNNLYGLVLNNGTYYVANTPQDNTPNISSYSGGGWQIYANANPVMTNVQGLAQDSVGNFYLTGNDANTGNNLQINICGASVSGATCTAYLNNGANAINFIANAAIIGNVTSATPEP